MTVSELIEELRAYPPGAEVVVVGHTWSHAGMLFNLDEFLSEPFVMQAHKDGRVVIST